MKQNISVNIEGVELPLAVDSGEEKMYRDATVLIQQRLRQLRETYPNLPQDRYYYAMALLYTAVDAVKAANDASAQPLVELMGDLKQDFDLVLSDADE